MPSMRTDGGLLSPTSPPTLLPPRNVDIAGTAANDGARSSCPPGRRHTRLPLPGRTRPLKAQSASSPGLRPTSPPIPVRAAEDPDPEAMHRSTCPWFTPARMPISGEGSRTKDHSTVQFSIHAFSTVRSRTTACGWIATNRPWTVCRLRMVCPLPLNVPEKSRDQRARVDVAAQVDVRGQFEVLVPTARTVHRGRRTDRGFRSDRASLRCRRRDTDAKVYWPRLTTMSTGLPGGR